MVPALWEVLLLLYLVISMPTNLAVSLLTLRDTFAATPKDYLRTRCACILVSSCLNFGLLLLGLCFATPQFESALHANFGWLIMIVSSVGLSFWNSWRVLAFPFDANTHGRGDSGE